MFMSDESEYISRLIETMVTRPGVYKMLNAEGIVVYVGKAKNLKNRVSSYFSKQMQMNKTTQLLSCVTDIEVIVTETEMQALLLENQLIKRFMPRYNVLLRDDKSYPYLYLSTQHAFARLSIHRGPKPSRGIYYGPYTNVSAVNQMIELVQKLFRLRSCNDRFFAHRSRPCLQYQINRCTAPCVSYIDQKAYQHNVELVQCLLEGRSDVVVTHLRDEMMIAAAAKKFEVAARCRDQIALLRHLQVPSPVLTQIKGVDVIALCLHHGLAVVQLVQVDAGQVTNTQSFVFDDILNWDPAGVLVDFLWQYLATNSTETRESKTIITHVRLSNKIEIETALSQSLGRRVKILDRVQGERKAWLEMAIQNAQQVFHRQQYMADKQGIRVAALARFLGLQESLSRIECFDISHISGTDTVASCVVFDQRGPVKARYRLYNLKLEQPGDDYLALHEGVTRRYRRMKLEGEALPDVLIIDGGKGQLNTVNAALEAIQVTDMCVLSISKGSTRKPGLETLHVSGLSQPIWLAPHAPELLLIQHCRDEAHRFAITAHRRRRAKSHTRSILEEVPGIGAVKRRVLLQHFGGLSGVKAASITELSAVPGMRRVLAERVYNCLHDQ